MIGKNKKMDYLLRGARGSFVRSLVEWFLQKNSMFPPGAYGLAYAYAKADNQNREALKRACPEVEEIYEAWIKIENQNIDTGKFYEEFPILQGLNVEMTFGEILNEKIRKDD